MAWDAMVALGAYHGINPGMGWLFAVALGMQQGSAPRCVAGAATHRARSRDGRGAGPAGRRAGAASSSRSRR